MPNDELMRTRIGFDDPQLLAKLNALNGCPARYDELAFGLIAMDLYGTVMGFNRHASQRAEIPAEHVLSLGFFTEVAPCTNNALVSGRFRDAAILDETIDYVLTLGSCSLPVRLRMLRDEAAGRQYLAVDEGSRQLRTSG